MFINKTLPNKELTIRSSSYDSVPSGANRSKKLNFGRMFKRRNGKLNKRLVRTGIVFGNFAIVGVAAALVIIYSGGNSNASNYSVLTTAEESKKVNPLDSVSSSEVAANIALMTKLPESGLVINEADATSYVLTGSASVSAYDTVIKPQILSDTIKTKADIQDYVVLEGDTVDSLSTKFGVTSDSIRWSNSLTGNRLVVGRSLVIPPVNGIVHTVKDGDTPDSLAGKFNVGRDVVTRFNDAEVSGLVLGDRIVIPGGSIAAAPASRPYYANFAFGNTAIYGYNGYVPGYCTYYAASRVSVPANWGDARAWASGARRTPGWNVSKTPVPGAVAQTTRMHYLGHVAVVEAVSEDGSMMKISDMNGIAGFNRVGYSDWISVGSYDWFIYR